MEISSDLRCRKTVLVLDGGAPLMPQIPEQGQVLCAEVSNRPNTAGVDDGHEVEVLDLPPVPLEVRHHDETLLGVGVLEDDRLGLLLVREDVVDPLDVKTLPLLEGLRHRPEESRRLVDDVHRLRLVLGNVLGSRRIYHLTKFNRTGSAQGTLSTICSKVCSYAYNMQHWKKLCKLEKNE